MRNQTIITIGREFGSGGHEIGEKVAKELGIHFYDKELISKTGELSGISEKLLMEFDEKPTDSFLYSIVVDAYLSLNNGEPLGQKVAHAEFDTIRKLAITESFVIVGRCAEYILRENPNVISIYVYADMDFKLQRVMMDKNMDEKQARKLIAKIDKMRSTYHNLYFDNRCGDPHNYDLMIKSSTLGIEKSAELILDYVNK